MLLLVRADFKNNVFYVYCFECFILARVGELVVKAVCELAYKQVLVSICQRSIASKALKGFIYVFQTMKDLLSVSQIYPDNMHLTGNNVYFQLNDPQMGISNFFLQGGFESFDGHMVLYGYDKNYNDCPAFGIMDPTLQSFDYYVLNDPHNNNVSFIDGCCGMDANGSDVDYLFVRDDGKISAIQENNLAHVVNIAQNTDKANRYTDVSWDPYHNLFIASGTAWTGSHYDTKPFVDVFVFNYALAEMVLPLGVNHLEFYSVDPSFNNAAPEGKALHTIIAPDSLVLYYDLGKGCYDIIWLTLIQDYWNSSHSAANGLLCFIPSSKIAAFDLVFDKTNGRLNLLGAMRYICHDFTCFLAQTDPQTLNVMNIGQLDGSSAIQPACSIPICQDYNQYIDIYGSYLKVQKMELNHHTPYSPILVSGIAKNTVNTSVLTETYDIASSVCDHPLPNSIESIIPDIQAIDYNNILQTDHAYFHVATRLDDNVSENFLCVDDNAYSLIYNGEENKKSLKAIEQHVDILFISDRQFVCYDFIGEIQYAVYATDGKLVMKGSTNNGVAINLPSVLRGVYLLKTEDKSGNYIVKKIVL